MTMLTDFYEITMSNGYFEHGMKDKIACFDMFFRKVPDNGGYAIIMGIEQLIDYIENLKFSDADIEYLRGRNIFSEEFLKYLKNFKFTSDVWAIEEGTPIFPHEPIVKVIGPAIEVQFVETMVLLTINHQSLIGTKTNRIVRAAKGRPVMEFGSRRAQGASGAIDGARAAYIAGCSGTACTISDVLYKTPALGGVRIDSGDITYLTKKVRERLDVEGLQNIKIVVSNSLDEYIIRDLLTQGAEIDSFGVGERLITSKSEPVFGGVYKLASVFENGIEIPKIKLSENVEKITTPCSKRVVRFYSKESDKAIADVLMLADEPLPDGSDYEIFDPQHTWKRKTVTNYYVKDLLVPIFKGGKCVYTSPDINSLREYCKKQVDTLWDEVKRFENPHDYYVDLSPKLWEIKNRLLNEHK